MLPEVDISRQIGEYLSIGGAKFLAVTGQVEPHLSISLTLRLKKFLD